MVTPSTLEPDTGSSSKGLHHPAYRRVLPVLDVHPVLRPASLIRTVAALRLRKSMGDDASYSSQDQSVLLIIHRPRFEFAQEALPEKYVTFHGSYARNYILDGPISDFQ
jgi:hypothetical protein